MRKTILAVLAALTLSLPALAEVFRPVAVDGPVTLGYRFPDYVDIDASLRNPGYGIVYVDGRTYWVELASRQVVRAPGAGLQQPEAVTYVGAGKSRVITSQGDIAPGLVLTPEAEILPIPGEAYGYLNVDGRVVFVDLATRTVLSVQ